MMQDMTDVRINKYEVPEGVSEYHAIIRVTNPRLTYREQVDAVLAAYADLMEAIL